MKEPIDKKFDERQLAARGKASSHALTALVIYLAADYLLCNHMGRSWAAPGVDAFLGLYFGAVVFSVECICRDAYFKVGENIRKHLWWMWLSAAVFVILIVLTLALPPRKIFFSDGLVTSDAIFPAMMVYYIVMTITITWRVFAVRREEREDAADGDGA